MDGRRERSDALSHQLDVRQLLNDLRYAQHKRDHEDADGCSADEAARPRPVALEAGSPPLGGRRFRDKLPLAPVRCDEVASLESLAAVDDLESPARDLEDGRQFRLRHVAPVSVEPCDDLAVRVTPELHIHRPQVLEPVILGEPQMEEGPRERLPPPVAFEFVAVARTHPTGGALSLPVREHRGQANKPLCAGVQTVTRT